MQNTQTVTAVIMVGVGSRYETQKQVGLSHFLEHMFFKGTKKRPTFQDIASELDAVGGEYNAFTGKDRTGYYVKVAARHGQLALDIISDIFLNAKLEESEIEKEKGTIIQEINMYEDTPRAQVGDIFESLMYRNSPLGRETIGNKETVKKFKKIDFVNYRNKHYISSNTVFCLAGNFNERKAIFEIGKIFAGLRKGKKTACKMVNDKQIKPAVKIKNKKTDQTHLILGCRAYHQEHPRRFALGVLATILGGNTSSRLFSEIREKRGLAYGVHTGIEAYADCGYLATQTGVDHGKLEETVKIILEEYKKIATQKVSSQELKKAKDYIKGISVMNFESSDEVAMFYVEQEARKGKVMTLPEIMKKIDKVTGADILRVAKDIFVNKKLNLAVIGPHKNSQKLGKILKL